MTWDVLSTVGVGVIGVLTAFVIGLWQILSAPDRPNYPTSGRVKRVIMFWFMASTLYRSVEIIMQPFGPLPIYATGGQMASWSLQFAFFVVMLVDHLRNWLPARTHGRIKQLFAVARCRPSKALREARASAMAASTGETPLPARVVAPALLELSLSGATVAGPCDGPEVFRRTL